jgi:hypothetical protein
MFNVFKSSQNIFSEKAENFEIDSIVLEKLDKDMQSCQTTIDFLSGRELKRGQCQNFQSICREKTKDSCYTTL